MHVDGFRFDLAPALARELYDVNRLGTFFDIIHQDPVLSQVKLIAEPWDVGPGGYQVGNFPIKWAEWNGKYRDCVRRFWRGDEGQVAELGYRLSGSSDLYQTSDRTPNSSINFVTCHDGFTLEDLVSYLRKHNAANGEEGRDGTDANWSANWGEEGPTGAPDVLELRDRIKRNLLAMLLFSQGVPMLLAGDEIGRTQRGNNNAYCQDNEVSWVDWRLTPPQQDLLRYTKQLVAIRRANPVLRRRSFFGGRTSSDGAKDVTWLRADGNEMSEADWQDANNHVLGMMIEGSATDETDARGRPIEGNTLLLAINGGASDCSMQLPLRDAGGGWYEIVHTASAERRVLRGEALHLAAHSLVLLGFGKARRTARQRARGAELR
jgi:glycogen operon protein